MSTSTYACVRAATAAERPAAALITVARFHGLDVLIKDARALAGEVVDELDLFTLPMVARRCGFDAVPLEGDFDALPELPCPALVLFKGADGAMDYKVLFEVAPDSAVIGDPTTGEVRTLSRDDFVRQWSGDAVQVLPEPDALEQTRTELTKLRDPVLRLRNALGLAPPYGSKVATLGAAFAVASTLAATSAGHEPIEIIARAAIGMALVLSLAAYSFSTTCLSCSRAANLAGGLPLALAGAAFYGALFGARVLGGELSLTAVALAFAAGAHLFLAGLLVKSRVSCIPCLATALVVLVACAAALPQAPALWPAHALAAGAGLGLSAVLIPRARELLELKLNAAALTLAGSLAEAPAPPPDRARLVVYKQKGCPACAFYDAVLRRALVDEFGERLDLDERDAAGLGIHVPFFFVRGRVNFFLRGLPPDEAFLRLQSAIALALDPRSDALGALGGLHLVQGRQTPQA